jgi:hypothetical protein
MSSSKRKRMGLLPETSLDRVLREENDLPAEARREGHHPIPDVPDPYFVSSSTFRLQVQVRISTGVKKMTAYRFLISRVCFEGMDLETYLVLWELHEWLGQSKDPSLRKFSDLYLFGEKILKSFRDLGIGRSKPFGAPTEFIEGFFTAHSYFGEKKKRVTPVSGISLVCPTPPKVVARNRVGVGYRDKGTLSTSSIPRKEFLQSDHWKDLIWERQPTSTLVEWLRISMSDSHRPGESPPFE